VDGSWSDALRYVVRISLPTYSSAEYGFISTIRLL